ncbi:MAG: ACP S-malonyltransferase [Proteobacteria bacterium]|nr:ACP S-malonyltransferase [Pseudomonadota bacterium]MBU1450667.1 ACP S-malonyltransferase [Pseudomonadota bacterium]MBU2467318.1 ACP S-malonyltransferase [Pseudomonadota bacterium]MBU2518205.1 ACP S-malonyltransferase [Pseudomonadota bacterium]
MPKVAVVFPGQGSQCLGMGQAWIQAGPAGQDIFALAEKASGLPLITLCQQGPLEELTRTVNLQPAVIAVDLCCWQGLVSAGVKPHAVAGHSVGEYAALAAAGVLSPAQCLELITLRGRLMDRDAIANPGAMAAIMGAGPEEVAALCQEVEGEVQPANYNTPAQTVITGERQAVAAAGALAKERGFKAIPLKVSGAWHSPLIAAAGRDMAEALAPLEFAAPACLHVPNTTGEPTADAAVIKNQLMKQLTAPVRWVQTIQALLDQGVEVFIEAGPKNVLAGLIKKTAPAGTTVLNVQEPGDLDQVAAVL